MPLTPFWQPAWPDNARKTDYALTTFLGAPKIRKEHIAIRADGYPQLVAIFLFIFSKNEPCLFYPFPQL